MFIKVAGEKKEYPEGLTVKELIEKEDVETPQYVTVTINDEFIESGLLGCENCYDVFSNKIDSLLKNIHGSNRHVGRTSKFIENNNNLEKDRKNEKKDNLKDKGSKLDKTSKIDELKEKLNKAIKEERYEDAAKIRDEIKKEEKK